MFTNKKIVYIGLLGLLLPGSILVAGKKKNNQEESNTSENIDAIVNQMKQLDFEQEKKRKEAQEKEERRRQEHLQKFPLTNFLGSSANEKIDDYYKRLRYVGNVVINSMKLNKGIKKLIENITMVNESLKNVEAIMTPNEILLNLRARTAEGVSLIYQQISLIKHVKELLKTKSIPKFVPKLTFEKLSLISTDLVSVMKTSSSIECFDIARKLLSATNYYCLIMYQKEILLNIKKTADDIETAKYVFNNAFLGSNQQFVNNNLNDMQKQLFADYARLGSDKIIEDSVLSECKTNCMNYHQKVTKLWQDMAREATLIEQELEMFKKQNVEIKNNIEESKKQTPVESKQKINMSAVDESLVVEQEIEPAVQQQQKPILRQVPLISYAEAIQKQSQKKDNVRIIEAIDFIKSYSQCDVIDWFNDTNKALARSIAKYPHSNQTEQQRRQNIIAHTFPFEMDGYVQALASQKIHQDDGCTVYYVPGSVSNNATKEEQTGYFSYVVTKHGRCLHRSFTLRNFSDDNVHVYEHPLLNIDPAEKIYEHAAMISPDIKILQTNFVMQFETTTHTYKMCISK